MNHHWFKHDVGTLTDKKMQKLLRTQGIAGFGVYWFIVESLYREDGQIRIEDLPDLAFTIHVTEEIMNSIVKDSGLFKYDNEYFWSDRVNQEIGNLKEKSEKAKKAVNARWSKNKDENNDTDVSQSYYGNDTNVSNLNYGSNTEADILNNNRNTERNTEENRREENRKEERESILLSNDAREVEDAFVTPPSPPPTSHQKTGKSKACGTHRNVFLTSQEYSSLSQTYGKDNVNTYINKLSAHMKIHGKSYLDHSAVLLKWLDEDGKTKPTTAREPPQAPTKCDRCGKPLVNGVCEPCGRRLYSQGGVHSFEDIADPSEMAEAIGKLRSAFAGG